MSASSHNKPPARKPSKKRTVKSSISLRPEEWENIDRLGELTRWGRSAVVSEAIDLMSSLPIPVVQKIVAPKQTPAGAALRERMVVAISEAVEEIYSSLTHEQLWDQMLSVDDETAEDLRRSGIANMSEEELVQAAVAAQKEVRQARRAQVGIAVRPVA